jgi:probable F420-dependent oxidoreductase
VKFTAEVTLASLCRPSDISGSAIAAMARAAESSGFDAIAFNDHPIPGRRWLAKGGHDAHDPTAVHAWCAAVTERLRVIPYAVVLSYRNPFVLAKAFASLDVLSEGRCVAAVCVGYHRSEFAAVGVPFEERNDRFDEAIDVMQAIWAQDQDQGLAFRGRFSQAIDQVATPRPVQDPLPLWIAGNSARSRERVARQAQGWAPMIVGEEMARTVRAPAIPTVAALADGIEDLRRRAKRAGRDPDQIEVQASGGPAAHGGTDFDAHFDWVSQLEDVGVTQHLVDFQIGGERDGLAELRRFGEKVVQRHG